MIARDVSVALTVVVAKAPYIHESSRFSLVLLQAPMTKCGKVSRKVKEIAYAIKHCEFTRHRIHSKFRIQTSIETWPNRHLFNWVDTMHLLKNDKTTPVTKFSGFLTHLETYIVLLYDRWLTCISQWTEKRDKVFDKLLMSFHMQKNTRF